MKTLIILLAVCLLAGCASVYAFPFPPECTGKEITCEKYGYGSCTLMYCPGTVTYDKNGNIIKVTDDCNQCTFTRRCWCEGHSFTITE